MNQSLSSSTMSMDRIHEEKFDVEDRLQKVREELEDIKRQNEEYQKNLSNMAKVSTLIPSFTLISARTNPVRITRTQLGPYPILTQISEKRFPRTRIEANSKGTCQCQIDHS